MRKLHVLDISGKVFKSVRTKYPRGARLLSGGCMENGGPGVRPLRIFFIDSPVIHVLKLSEIMDYVFCYNKMYSYIYNKLVLKIKVGILNTSLTINCNVEMVLIYFCQIGEGTVINTVHTLNKHYTHLGIKLTIQHYK